MTERIRLSARLDREGHVTLRPAFPTAIPPERWRQDTLAYVVEVLDAQGRPLARVPLSVSGTCDSSSTALRGSVDLPDGAVRLDVLRVDTSGRAPSSSRRNPFRSGRQRFGCWLCPRARSEANSR